MTICREQLLSSARTRNLELECRIIAPFELQVAAACTRLAVPFRLLDQVCRQNVLRAVLGCDVFGVDSNVQTLLGLVGHLKS